MAVDNPERAVKISLTTVPPAADSQNLPGRDLS